MNLSPPIYSLYDFPIAIASIDLDFQILDYSEKWLKEFPASYNQATLYLNTFSNIPVEIIEKITLILKRENEKIETLQTKNNQNLWFQWKINALKDNDGTTIGAIIIVENITELKNTQLKLSENEESFKGAFEKSSIGMASVGIDGSWLDVNESISKSLGYTREELLKLTFQDITHPDDLNKDLAQLTKIINGKIQNYQIEKRYFHKDGSIVYAILTVTSVRDFEGKLSHFISQIMDITSRIKAENKTKKLIELTKNQNQSLLNFAHIVSHNLRSHSTNLLMLTGFLKDETDVTEKETIQNMLSDASESLSETVSHLNDVVQITTSSKDQLKKVNLLKAIKSVEKNISALLQEKNVKYNFEIPEDLNITAVPAYLESILLNLLTNSIKYSSPNRRPEINITTIIKNENIILNFSDNGQGIDLIRHGEKLFGMYKTFHEHEDAKGIGLFITKNQIEAMNGSIKVISEVDKGTTFILTFETWMN